MLLSEMCADLNQRLRDLPRVITPPLIPSLLEFAQYATLQHAEIIQRVIPEGEKVDVHKLKSVLELIPALIMYIYREASSDFASGKLEKTLDAATLEALEKMSGLLQTFFSPLDAIFFERFKPK